MAPADRFFSYKHYLDGNGELIDLAILRIVAKAMIRNKPDSYCQAWEIDTHGVSARRQRFSVHLTQSGGHFLTAGDRVG